MERVPPKGKPVMFQNWHDLLFLHWPISTQAIQETLPEGLTVDTWQDQAWLGIVPFRMTGVRPRWLPSVPMLSNFLELNVRTYVRDEKGRTGVWFYSLDCDQPFAVEIARGLFHLNYFYALIGLRRKKDLIKYTSWRHDRRTPSAQPQRAQYLYQPTGMTSVAAPGTIEYFFLERYRLFSQDRKGRIRSGRVFHQPYQYQSADLKEYSIDPALADGLALPDEAPSFVHYAREVNVEVFPLETGTE